MTEPRITDVRDAEDARPGQQALTVQAANIALEHVDGATCVVLLSFVPMDNGGWRCDVGVGGTGPSGFGETVSNCMRASAEPVALAMAEQERRHAARSRA